VVEQQFNQCYENHLCFCYQRTEKLTSELLHFPDDQNIDGSQNIGLLAVQSSDVAANPKSFIKTRITAILMRSSINQPIKNPRAETCAKFQSMSCGLFSHFYIQNASLAYGTHVL
jgi:hypothetical protein